MTTENKHTPGPWRWVVDGDGNMNLESMHKQPNKFAPEGYIYPTVLWAEREAVGYDGCNAIIETNRDEDARLIAAAPELLNALEGLVQLILDCQLVEKAPSHVGPIMLGRALDAIAKAKGLSEPQAPE